MANFLTIRTQVEIANQNASSMLTTIRDFMNAKAPGGDDLTLGQKTTLRTNFLASLKAVEDEVVAIRTELTVV